MTQTARKTALAVLDRCFGSRAWSSQTLNAAIAPLEERDRAFTTRLVMGVLQNYKLIDYTVDHYLTGNKNLDLTVRNVLRLGAYQILFSDRIPNRAAVNESVKLCRSSGFTSAGGLVNAVLRRIAEFGIPPVEHLCIRYSHPEWFVQKMLALHGAVFTEALLKANNTEPEISRHAAFAEGETYVQDPAAYASVAMAQPVPGSRVLDACAAPGGKSFTAAVLMKNEGSILSCDISEKKLGLVRSGAERLGISIVSTCCADASEHRAQWEEAFDLVIADVPCSGFGVIRKKPEIRLKSESDIAPLPAIQKRIAQNLATYVRPGGTLLYSTCTVFPEENEEVAHNIEGFTVAMEKTFWPHIDGTDGFYACVLKKQS